MFLFIRVQCCYHHRCQSSFHILPGPRVIGEDTKLKGHYSLNIEYPNKGLQMRTIKIGVRIQGAQNSSMIKRRGLNRVQTYKVQKYEFEIVWD